MSDDRKHLAAREVEKLLEATRGGRHEARDRCLRFMMFRHGLRASEACALRLDQVDIESRVLHVARLKKGLSTTHPLHSVELRFIKAWLAERAGMKPPRRTFFVSRKRQPLNRRTVWLAIRKYGDPAGLELPAHPQLPNIYRPYMKLHLGKTAWTPAKRLPGRRVY
jgi:integrase